MINIGTNNSISDILSVLAVAGEMSPRSLKTLGDDNTLKRLIKRGTVPQEYRNAEDGSRVNATLFTVSGHGAEKTIRLKKEGIEVLNWVADAEYYKAAFCRNNFGSGSKVKRHHTLAEAAMLFQSAGIEIQPYNLPTLSGSIKNCREFNRPYFYTSTVLKYRVLQDLGEYDRITRMSTSRFAGMFTTPGNGVFAIYNTGNSPISLNINAETNLKHEISDLKRTTFYSPLDVLLKKNTYQAIVLCSDLQTGYTTAVTGLFEGQKNKWKQNSRRETLVDIYDQCHGITLDDFGAKMLLMLSEPNYYNILKRALFLGWDLLDNNRSLYDARRTDENGQNVLAAMLFDFDFKRIEKLKGSVEFRKTLDTVYEVYAFEEQCDFLENLLGKDFKIVPCVMDAALELLWSRR